MSKDSKLPASWVQVTVADLGKVVSGGTPSTKEPSFWNGGISWISPSDLTGYVNKFISKGAKSITQEGLNSSSAVLMPAGSIHFSSRAPIGYTVISTCDMTTNQGFKSLVPATGVFNEFIYYYLKSAKQLAEKNATGTTFKEISGSAFGKLPVPLPPTNEQHRIVAKIEELFSELEKGVESLKAAKAQLTVYRQSVLKAAFEGRLTESWRKEHTDELESADELLARIKAEREARYEAQLAEWQASSGMVGGKKNPKPKKLMELPPLTDDERAALPELPEGWLWNKAGVLSDVVRGGSPRPAGDPKYYDGNIPFLKVADITNTSSPYVKSYSHTIKEAGLKKTRQIKPNTLLLSNSGATLGVPKICLIEATMNDGIAAFLDLDEDDLVFHYYFWMSKTRELRAINQGAAQPNLNTDLIKGIPIPLCSQSERNQIVQEIEERFSVVEKMEQTIEESLQKAEALRQSILKRAFEGKLVPQDPNDEPASELLARIRAERAKVAPTPRRKRKETA